MEDFAVDIESRLPGLWKEVRPKECFDALYKDISNFMIFVIRRDFFHLTFSRDCYQFMCKEKKVISFSLSPLYFVDLLRRNHNSMCAHKNKCCQLKRPENVLVVKY